MNQPITDTRAHQRLIEARYRGEKGTKKRKAYNKLKKQAMARYRKKKAIL